MEVGVGTRRKEERKIGGESFCEEVLRSEARVMCEKEEDFG